MNGGIQPCRRDWGSLALGVLLSLLLHVGLAWALDLLPPGTGRQQQRRPAAQAVRHVQVLRRSPVEKKQQKPSPQELPQEPQGAFVKTSADEPSQRPEQADFIGSRDTRADGAPDAPQRSNDAPLPTMAGRVSEDEIVTFDQERQDGELAHEGKEDAMPTPPPLPAEPEEPLPPTPDTAVAQGSPEGSPEQSAPQGEGARPPQPAADITAALRPEPASPGEGLTLDEWRTEDSLTLNRPLPPPAALGQEEGSENAPESTRRPARPQRPQAVYDPSLAASAQHPGLRTYERRTRSTGRFVFGRRPSLNVAATARGRYEAVIYRRIARVWYAACDAHRGDIIPGSITVSLRLTKNGRIDSMDLVRRRGASLIQQSFSFGAIRQAALPPMPAEVQRELIGRLHEMILTFNFD